MKKMNFYFPNFIYRGKAVSLQRNSMITFINN